MEVLFGAAAAAVMVAAGISLSRWFRKNRTGSGKAIRDSSTPVPSPSGRPRRKMGQFQAEVIRYTYM